MLKLLIIDDEPVVRNGLKEIINWAEYGFEVCGEADNGKTGIEMAEKLSPDLIIADIRMPEIDGLEMAKRLKEKNYAGHIIILTGYAEFSYAKKAISYGVNAYLLKPIDEDELINAIKGTREKIFEKQKLKEFINENALPLKYVIPKKILMLEYDEKTIQNVNMMHRLNLPWKSYQLILLKGNEGFANDNDQKQRAISEVQSFVSKGVYIYVFEENEHIAMLLRDITLNTSRQYISILRDKIYRGISCNVDIAISNAILDINDVKESYKTLSNYLDKSFIYSVDGIIIEQEIIENYKAASPEFEDINNYNGIDDIPGKIYGYIAGGCKNKLPELIEKLQYELIKKEYTQDKMKLIYVNILAKVTNMIKLNYSKIDMKKYHEFSIIDEINDKKYLKELSEYILLLFSSMADQFVKPDCDNKIDKLIEYIKANYDKNLSIESLADIFNYSRAYLGQLFKNTTGLYFNSYMDSLRVEKAKEFLAEGYKVYEVAAKVGFNDVNYFYSKFKKYAGVSPKEYKVKK